MIYGNTRENNFQHGTMIPTGTTCNKIPFVKSKTQQAGGVSLKIAKKFWSYVKNFLKSPTGKK